MFGVIFYHFNLIYVFNFCDEFDNLVVMSCASLNYLTYFVIYKDNILSL